MYLAIVIRDAFLHYLGENLYWPLGLQQEVEQLMLMKRKPGQFDGAKLTKQDVEDVFFGRINFRADAWKFRKIRLKVGLYSRFRIRILMNQVKSNLFARIGFANPDLRVNKVGFVNHNSIWIQTSQQFSQQLRNNRPFHNNDTFVEKQSWPIFVFVKTSKTSKDDLEDWKDIK